MIKQLAVLVVVALSLTGCQKATDLGRVQEEALDVVKVHVKVLDQLQRRADALLKRGQSIGGKGQSLQGIAEAGKVLTDARGRLDQLRGQASAAPAAIAAAVKTGNEEDVYKTSDDLVEQLETGATVIRADLDIVESWLWNAELRPALSTPPTPTPIPAPTPTPEVVPAPAAGSAAPAAAGSAAPPAAPTAAPAAAGSAAPAAKQ